MLMDEENASMLIEWQESGSFAPEFKGRVLKELRKYLVRSIVVTLALGALAGYLLYAIGVEGYITALSCGLALFIFGACYVNAVRIHHFKKGRYRWFRGTVEDLFPATEQEKSYYIISSDVKAYSLDGALRRGTGVVVVSYRDIPEFIGKSFAFIDKITMVKG